MVVAVTGTDANLVCFRWLENHNKRLGTQDLTRIPTHTASARFKFVSGRRAGVRFAADISVGIAERTGALTAFALGADIPKLSRKSASATQGR